MSDLYSRYEIGLRRLLEQMGRDHPLYSGALVYQQRLDENVAQSRRYGDTDTRKAERSEIIDRLNELALSVLGTSFSELCKLSTPVMRQRRKDPGYSNILQELEALEGGKSLTDPVLSSRILEEMGKLFSGRDSSSGKGETELSTPEQQFALTVLTQAVGFLFEEARTILAERRQRRQELEEPDDVVALPAGVEESSKETILELKPTNLDEETQEEIKHLLELIKIQKDHRRKAELKINKLGGILYVPPNVRVELENAEDEILKHTRKLKKLMEKVYNQPIYIDGLE